MPQEVSFRRAPFPLPDPPPAGLTVVGVADVTYGGVILSFNVIFDTTVEEPINDPSGADPSKWRARYEGGLFVGASLGWIDFDRINVGLVIDDSEAGADEFWYLNAPSDV